ncbi:hypothetical protein O181_097138, partial [Austropuccinia psidii MF-1]|nr:hypothetical protein [Austropuccinia psidii MF-1]
MTRKQTCAMGRGQLTLYSLVLQPPPLFKHYYQAIRPRGIPCIRSLTITNTCDACQQAHKKCSFIVRPFRPQGQRSSCPRRPCEDSFVVNDDETISKREWTLGPQAGRREQFQTISPVPSSIDLSTPPPRPPSNGHLTPLPERSDYLADEGWRCKFSFSSLSHFSSRNNTDFFPLLIEQNPQNPPRQDSPIPSLPREQTPWQPTPGPSGTRWSEELFR